MPTFPDRWCLPDLELAPSLFERILDASGIPMVILDLRMRPLDCNRTFIEAYGYSWAELRASSIETILPGFDTKKLDSILKTVAQGREWEDSFVIRSKSGAQTKIQGRFDPVQSRGEIVHLILTVQNAFHTKRIRRALAATERHLRFLADNTSDCLFRLSLPDLTLDYISPSVEGMLGYTQQEFYNSSQLAEQLVPELWKDQLHLETKKPRGPQNVERQWPIRHKDGHSVWVSQRLTVTDDDAGSPSAVEGIITDITERKEAEEALQESESSFRFLAENIHDVVWTADNDMTLTYVTPSAFEVCGYSPMELVNSSYRSLFTQESLSILEEAQAIREEHDQKGDYDHIGRLVMEFVRGDGKHIWLETIVQRILDREGVPIGYQGLSRDVTAKRESENLIRENENRFRTLFEESPISLWEEDLTRLKAYFDDLKKQGITDFRHFFYTHPEALGICASLVDVVAVNKATLDLLHAKSREELLGNLDKVLTESSMAAFTEEMILLASGGCEYCGEITHRTLDGEIIWVVVNFSVPTDYHDSLSRVIVSLIDVTPRKRAEEALMESEERYRALVENSQEGVVVVKSGVPVFINDAMKHILGYPTDELKQLHPLEVVHPDDAQHTRKIWRKLACGIPCDEPVSFRAVTKNGQSRWLTMTAKPILWGGEEAVMEILTDVTAHKHMEQELRAAHAEMEDRVKKRTVELSRANIRLTEEATERERAQERILSLTQQLIRVQEDERQRIARDLHDNVAQNLSSMLLHMETLFDGVHQPDATTKSRVDTMTRVMREAVAEVRAIAYGLRPPALDQLGLVLALHNFCDDASTRSPAHFDFFAVGMDNLELDFEAAINLYRMVQEAVSNIVKHAKASAVMVRLVVSHPALLVRIEDNGRGFNVEERTAEALLEKRMGLQSMEERARLIGGTMEIQSRTDVGTRILFTVPLNNIKKR